MRFNKTCAIGSVFVMLCIWQVLTALSWKRKPSSQSVALGRNVTFHCEINDLGGRDVIWHDSSYNILFNNDNRFNAPSRYTIEGEFNLVITNITKEDKVQVVCNVKDLGLEAANLTVLYSPHITFSPYNMLNVHLGRNADLECRVDANPPVSIVSWRKDGQPLPGTSFARVFRPTVKSDSGEYMCIANNLISGPRNATIKLSVMYPPKITIPNTVTVSERERVNITCNIDAKPEPYEVHWERVGSGQAPISSLHLVFDRIQREDAGNYTCKAWSQLKISGEDTQNVMKQAFTVINVELAPNPPNITLNATGGIHRENQVLVLTCSSNGGNPNPTMHWLKNGHYLTDNIEYNPATSSRGVSNSRLTVVLDRTDHRANYICVVYNAVNTQNPLSTFHDLQVQYSPHITFSPYNPLNVHLGRNADLECRVDANPPVSTVSWRKDSQTLPGTSSVRGFRPIVKSDSGEYTCIANNHISGPRNATIKFSVMYPPTITIPNTVTASESERVNISCNIDAKPEPYEVHWERVGSGQAPISSLHLVFDRIQRGDAGNYTCKAWSQMQISGENTQTAIEQEFTVINVEYPPGSAFIKSVGDNNVGESVELKCSASPEGYPAAHYEWKKTNVVMSQTSATYRINSTRLSDIGEYVCTPVNKVGRGQSNRIHLSINEPPTLIASPKSDYYVPLTDERLLQMKCVARGRPSPVITWFKNNDDIPLTTLYPTFYRVEQSNQTTDEHSFKITNLLYFRGQGRNMTSSGTTHLRVDDTGNYTCRVTSPTHTDTVRGRASVLVLFSPQAASDQERVSVDIAQSAFLPCITYAYPDPAFRWYRNSVQIMDGGRFSTRIDNLDNKAKFQSVLSIRSVQRADLGGYTCRVLNSFGIITIPIRLSLKYPIRQEDLEVSSIPPLLQYIVGSNVTLKCEVKGNPISKPYWKKDEHDHISWDKKEWVLTNLDLADRGIYRCYAHNNVMGVMYTAIKAIYIFVVDPATTTITTIMFPTTADGTGSTTDSKSYLGTGLVVGVGLILVLLVLSLILIFICRRKKSTCLSVSGASTNETAVLEAMADYTVQATLQHDCYQQRERVDHIDIQNEPSDRPPAYHDLFPNIPRLPTYEETWA